MNTLNRLIILLGIILLFLIACEKEKIELGEYGALKGVVYNSETNNPIEGVAITTSPATSSILTNKDGEFSIEDIIIGDITITAKKTLYNTSTATVLIKIEETTNVEITLDKSDDYYTNIKIDNPFPENESTDMGTALDLSWKIETEYDYDSLNFNVIQYKSNSCEQTLIAEEIKDTTISVNNLNYNTTYFWQVIAIRNDKKVCQSDIWSYTTKEFPDYPYLYTREVNNNYELFYSDTVVSNQIQLTNSASSFDWYPKINPERTKIAFTSNRSNNPQIYTMDRDGSNIKKITSICPNIGYFNMGEGFCWSPNGQYILYTYYHELYRIGKSGYGLTKIATAPEGRNFKAVDWNGNTNKIIVQTISEIIYDSEIYIMNENGSEMEMLIDNLPGRIESPSFSINGEDILFTHDIDEFNSPDGRQLNSHIFLYNIEADTSIDLSYNKEIGTNDLQCKFSPTGGEIIFVNTPNTGTKTKEIWKMDIDGENRTLLIVDGEMPECI